MDKYMLPMDIFKNKEDIAMQIYKQDLASNPSLVQIKDKYLQDTIYTLRFLSTSLEVGEPLIFANYMKWFGSLANYLHFNLDAMKHHFEISTNIYKKSFSQELLELSMHTYKLGIDSFEQSFLLNKPTVVDYDDFLNYLIAMDSDQAYQYVLKHVDAGMDLKEVYLNILQPTLYKVGDLWQQRVITVAKEHYITAAIQHIIGKLYSKLFTYKESSRYSMTAVCAGNELHEIGMRMVADFFELSGWDSIYLGSNIPVSTIIDQLLERPTHLVAISATTSSQLIEVRDLIRKIKSNPSLKYTKIIVGGRVFNETPLLWKTLGADGNALDAEQAVILGALLVGESYE